MKPRVTDHQFGIRHYAGEVGVHSVSVRMLAPGCEIMEYLDFQNEESL